MYPLDKYDRLRTHLKKSGHVSNTDGLVEGPGFSDLNRRGVGGSFLDRTPLRMKKFKSCGGVIRSSSF